MAGINPVAAGILSGGASGAASGALMGSAAGGIGALPGAAIGFAAGAIMGGAAGSEEQKKQMAAKKAAADSLAAGIKNQNAVVEDSYNKKKQARGLADTVSTPNTTGDLSGQQSGAVLTSPTGNTTNILG